MNTLPYDKTSKKSIEEFGLKLKGTTFRDVLENYINISTNEPLSNEDKAMEKLKEYLVNGLPSNIDIFATSIAKKIKDI